MKNPSKTLLPLVSIMLVFFHIQCGNPANTRDLDYGKFGYVSDPHLEQVLKELTKRDKSHINDKNANGKAPIHLALNNTKDLGIIEFLVREGVDVDAIDEAGNTALILSAKMLTCTNRQDIIRLLLKNKANGNIQNEDGETALMSLLIHNKYSDSLNSEVKLLANDQTDFLLKDEEGNHPLHLAMDIPDAKTRKKTWKHILNIMEKTLQGKYISTADIEKFCKNKEGKTPENILWNRSANTRQEIQDFKQVFQTLRSRLAKN